MRNELIKPECNFLRLHVLVADCVTPFANALRKLSAHANAEGKTVIQQMIAEITKHSTCVTSGDVKCIQQHLAQSVGIVDMIKQFNLNLSTMLNENFARQ